MGTLRGKRTPHQGNRADEEKLKSKNKKKIGGSLKRRETHPPVESKGKNSAKQGPGDHCGGELWAGKNATGTSKEQEEPKGIVQQNVKGQLGERRGLSSEITFQTLNRASEFKRQMRWD